MRKYASLFVLIVLILSAVRDVSGQEAIRISKLLEDDEDISIHDISRIDQTVIVADSLEGWDASWVSGLNGAQAAYDNWSQGGTNTISVTASTVFNLMYRKDRFAYALNTNFKYGKARIQDEGTRKTDDRIAINNKFSYLFDNKRWSAFANINFSTQFDKGFNYNVPDGENPELISEIFSPAYFTQVVGIAYTPADYFSAQTGLAMKETIVANDALAERYGLYDSEVSRLIDPFSSGSYGVYTRNPKSFRFEPGYSAAFFFEKDIFKNVHLVSSVETFTNLQRHINRTDINFSNEVVGKINDFMNMSFQFVMIYDEDFSKQVQVKQVLSAGLSVNIL
ncbi:DUF3078 domain-containing protein [Fodinibius salsisoli]|uniref:DUF3078 domain-containing protein n=1 Tax=Fodinibius salsisoli TaxID=2820877 RepID=A0ABT3PRR8_9BACT|nr:DUF3078 domain-containing protein [Fodinibius salsisoli]MCW9708558.1 DUF3078 domain-containing protein [Fodinibius salsisoli]